MKSIICGLPFQRDRQPESFVISWIPLRATTRTGRQPMAIERWNPQQELSRQEAAIIKRLGRVRKFLAFLRRHRHELVDEAFQAELASMYRDTGAGKDPLTPGLMAMATLVQGYLGASDATMVELTVIDLTVQMVLGVLGS